MTGAPMQLHERIDWGKVRRVLVLLLVLLVALGSVAVGLATVTHNLDVGLLFMVAAVGMLVGWLMAAARLPGWLAGILAILVGIVVLFLSVGHLEDELGAFVRALVGVPSLGWAPVSAALARLGGEVEALVLRWGAWALTLIDGNPAFDPISAALVWGLGLWAVAVWAGWKLRLHQPVLSLIPASVLLVVTLYWVEASTFSLLPLLGATLLLTALTWHDARERRWEAVGIHFNRYVWGGLARLVAPLSLALVVVAALIPTISVQEVADAVERLTDEWEGDTSASESLGLERQPGAGSGEGPFGIMRLAGLPRRHLLGAGSELSWQTAMVVYTGDQQPVLPERARRYYWRGATYDQYDGHGWSTSGTEVVDYEAGELVALGDMPFHRLVRQEVRVVGDLGGVLHVAGTLVAVDQDYRVAWRSSEDAFGATIEETIYRVDSLEPLVSEEQLRSAGSDYPEWVRDRYLAVPDTVPERVLLLARNLAADEPTPYDRARAIERFLRQYPYTRDVTAPPFEQDVVDYFLFDLQEGYCDYYASAMVVLARASGVPARLVVGYAGGTYDVDRAHYVITEANAHSWVEVYFPGYGWVEFEPTASRPSIEWPVDLQSVELPEPEPLPEPGDASGSAAVGKSELPWGWWLVLPAVLALVIGGGFAWSAADRWQLRHLDPAATVVVLYGRLRRYGQRLPVPVRAGDTPYEFAQAFNEWGAGLARRKRWGGVLAAAAQDVHHLTELYVRASYSSDLPDSADRAQAVKTWRGLYWRLWLARIWGGSRRKRRH